jgi:hypothetical protein
MNKHVAPLESDDRKTTGFAPSRGEIAREEALRDLPQAQIGAINCLIDIIDEPYTGDDDADFNLRRNKIAAANVLLSMKTRFLREAGFKAQAYYLTYPVRHPLRSAATRG